MPRELPRGSYEMAIYHDTDVLMSPEDIADIVLFLVARTGILSLRFSPRRASLTSCFLRTQPGCGADAHIDEPHVNSRRAGMTTHARQVCKTRGAARWRRA